MAKRLGNNTVRISFWLNIASTNPANYIIGTDKDEEAIFCWELDAEAVVLIGYKGD